MTDLPGKPGKDEPLSTRLKWICDEIQADMERDVALFDGRPLDGRTVAEIHGTLAATISGLAALLAENQRLREQVSGVYLGLPLPADVCMHRLKVSSGTFDAGPTSMFAEPPQDVPYLCLRSMPCDVHPSEVGS